ncbi:unnamed protein product, partial [Ectocarpus sp. 4 AP-2014]
PRAVVGGGDGRGIPNSSSSDGAGTNQANVASERKSPRGGHAAPNKARTTEVLLHGVSFFRDGGETRSGQAQTVCGSISQGLPGQETGGGPIRAARSA